MCRPPSRQCGRDNAVGAACVDGGVVHSLCVWFRMAGVLKTHWVGGYKTEEKAVHDGSPLAVRVNGYGEEGDLLGDKFADDCFAFNPFIGNGIHFRRSTSCAHMRMPLHAIYIFI